jgi:hypothetical protein
MSTYLSGTTIEHKVNRPAVARSDVSGLLALLISAKLSLEKRSGANPCIGYLEACVTRLRRNYNLTDWGVDERAIQNKVSIDALLRLLEYVRAEVQDKLDEKQCVRELGFCIAHLTDTRQRLRKYS